MGIDAWGSYTHCMHVCTCQIRAVLVAIHTASMQGDDTITSLTVDEAEVILIRHWHPTQLKFAEAIYSVGMTQLMQPLMYVHEQFADGAMYASRL